GTMWNRRSLHSFFFHRRRTAKATATGLNLRLVLFPAAAAAGGTLEQRQLIAAMDNGREVVLEQTGFFARDEARQHENGLARASFPNGDAFVGAGHAKPVRAGSLKGFGDLWPAVAVAVALDDGQDLARRLALLSRRIHVVANGCEVVRERTERNLGP